MLNFVPEDWMIGTLGIIPLILGIRAIFTDDDEADEAVEQIEGRGNQSLFWTVSLVTIASGGDNLGIYIPYFASLEWGENSCCYSGFCRRCCRFMRNFISL